MGAEEIQPSGPIFLNIAPTFLNGDNLMLCSNGNYVCDPSFKKVSFDMTDSTQITRIDTAFLQKMNSNIKNLLTLTKSLKIEAETETTQSLKYPF